MDVDRQKHHKVSDGVEGSLHGQETGLVSKVMESVQAEVLVAGTGASPAKCHKSTAMR